MNLQERMENIAPFMGLDQFESVMPSADLDRLKKRVDSIDCSTTTQVLIATDTIARGFDLPDVHRVVQLDFSTNVVTFLHRVGRTARCGKQGEVVHFVTESDERLAKMIQKALEVDETGAISLVDSEARLTSEATLNADQAPLAKYFSRNRSLRHRQRQHLNKT
jgi:superfamily II DNA/RNA helicase